MKIIVTGGAGFIGSHFIKYMLEEYPECEILNYDKLTYAGNLQNLRSLRDNPHYTFMKGDIADAEQVEQAFQWQPDAVVNFAAETHVDRSIGEPAGFIKTDVFGTHVLLEAVKNHGVERYLQVSTDEVYGSCDDGAFTEQSPLEPNSPYSASKAGGDLQVRAYFVTYGLPVLITRASNNYGPNQYPEKLIPLFITNAIENKPLPLYGDGLNVRDWLYVTDHCRGIDTVLRQGKFGEVYNIGGNEERTNIEVTKMILNELGKSEDLIKPVKDRPGHDKRYALSCEKLQALGWKPEVTFEEGLRKTVQWYLKNEKWWKPLKSGEFLEYYKKQYQQC